MLDLLRSGSIDFDAETYDGWFVLSYVSCLETFLPQFHLHVFSLSQNRNRNCKKFLVEMTIV